MKISLFVILMFNLHVSAYALNLSIPSYPENSVIPNEYTFSAGSQCSGENISPQLIWSDVPDDTLSFAVVFIDENFDFLHWKLYNIGAEVSHIPESNPNAVGVEGLTNFGINGYGGPCPPSTTPGNYVMTVYALNTIFSNEPSVAQIQAAAIESASWLAFRNISDDQQSYEYSARYRMTFEGDWRQSTHPNDYPNDPHFSQLIGSTHAASGVFWQPQTLATEAVENMAETGGISLLVQNLQINVNASGSESVIIGDDNEATGSVVLEFTVSQSHPLFSMVTMIAPSPDWFVGVSGLDLRENGQWQENVTIDLLPYDSGTDSGQSFMSANENTDPAELIQRLQQLPLPDNVPLGRFVFERLNVSGIVDLDSIFNNGFE